MKVTNLVNWNNLSLKTVTIVISLLAVVSYWGTWNTFFQQDEWVGLGNYFAIYDKPFLWKLQNIYSSISINGIGHFLPLVPVTNLIRTTIFELNYTGYAFLSLITHIISTVLVFKLAVVVTKNAKIALLGAVLFVVSSSASQVVTWVSTSIPTQYAMIFSLLSIIFFVNWLEDQKITKLVFSILFLFIAIMFKETAFFLFIFLPILSWIKKGKQGLKVVALFIFAMVFYLLLRILLLSISIGLSDAIGKIVQLLLNFGSNYLKVVLTGITQSIFPSQMVLMTVEKIVFTLSPELPKAYTTDVFVQNRVAKFFVFTLGGMLLLIYLFIIKKSKDKFPLLFCLAFILTSLIPITLIAPSELNSTFLPPRSLYIPLVGISIGLSYLLMQIKRQKIVFLLIMSILLINVFIIHMQIQDLQRNAIDRKGILKVIKSEYAKLPEKVIFYVESNKSYYGLPEEEKILPFQSGFGQTLLVWYAKTEKFPEMFFKDKFLWDIKSQGYIESDGRGYGYFRDKELLKKTVEEYNIPLDSVIAFSWKGNLHVLQNITDQTRMDLNK